METGLVGLRAELQKKRDEASRRVPGQRGVPGRDREARPKTFSASNAGVSRRAERDEEQRLVEGKTEENARQALERKAAMYDKLQGGTEVLEDDQLNQRFLVNFQKKIVEDVMDKKKRREEEEEKEKTRQERQKHHEEANPNEYAAGSDDQEWVEYTDTFGRTRQCLRAELAQRLEHDRQLSRDLNQQDEAEGEAALDPHLLEDLQKEAQRRRWEAEEALNATKKDLHYQDVLYNEARSHGPGFLRFSRDEQERKAQMELLRDLRAETQRAEAATAATSARRQKSMKARLEKVRQRKRLKMGLPVRDDDKLRTPPGSGDEDEAEEKVEPVNTPPSPPPKPKTTKVREWDLGKTGVTSTLTQEEWVLRQRSQRSQDFAPPSSYEPRGSRTQPGVSYQDKRSVDRGRETYPRPLDEHNTHGSFREDRRPEFAPPATHEYYGPTARPRSMAHHSTLGHSVEAAIGKGLAHLRKMSDQ